MTSISVTMETTLETGEEGWLADCFDTSDIEARSENCAVTVPCTMVRSENTDEQKENKRASKPHSTPLTLKWLEDNYELAEGVCIPRNTLYIHYLDFCNKNNSQPVNAASFGKIIRQQFPHLTTRRLGTRGQSRYHYYGIGVKETSPYYEVMYSRKGVNNRPPDGRKEPIRQMVTYSPRSKLGTLLPEFPDIKQFKLPPDVTMDKVTTFLMMYRTHCQRILDTVIRANFDEVQSFLLHFWQGMPQHIVPILGTTFIVNLVGVCDSILYKAISVVLMPTVLQALPDSLTQVIRKFARQLDEWLRLSLQGLPELLKQTKFDLSRRFSQMLKRQTSLNHLCQAARTVIHSSDITTQMLEDWRHIDLNSICKQTLYTLDSYNERDHQVIVNLYKEFERLVQEQAPLEAYMEWLDTMTNACVVQVAASKPGSMRRIARQFLLMWSCFGTRVIRDMTLHSAPSFGSFHLLHLMFDDYVLYHVETLYAQERSNDLLRAINGQELLIDPKEEDILPKPHFTDAYALDPYSNQTTSSNTMPTDRQTVITANTREGYGNTNQYNTSPLPHSSHSGESPSRSSMTSYENRGDTEMQLSPIDGDARTYMRYGTGNVTTDSTAPGDLTTNYQYPAAPVNASQYQYPQRDYSRAPDWSDKYGSLTTSVTSYQQSTVQYSGNYAYGREFEATAYHGYDPNTYTAPMRTHPQVNSYYGQYGNDVRSCDENNTTDLSTRKRKSQEGDRDYCIKKANLAPGSYDYGMSQNYITVKPI